MPISMDNELFGASMEGMADEVYAMQIPYDTHPVDTEIAARS